MARLRSHPLAPPAKKIAPARGAAAKAVLRDFRIIFSSVRKHFAWLERSCGIGGAQVWALAVMAKRPGLRVSDLAVALAIHQSTASNLLEKLIRRRLARRRRDLSDRRVVRLELTAQGRRLTRRAPRPVEGVLPDALGRLPASALKRLKSDLGALILKMQNKDERAAYTPLADL